MRNDAFARLERDRYDLVGMLGWAESLASAGDFRSAQIVLLQAVAKHPQSADAHSALGGVLLELDELLAARDAFIRALDLDPLQRKAWAGLGVVFERAGDVERADRAWREAFRHGGPAVSRYRGEGAPVRVLLLCSAVDGNIPLGAVFDERIFSCITLFVESYDPSMQVPPFDVAFNTVGNADLPGRALAKAQQIAATLESGVINDPADIRATGRAHVAQRLGTIAGLVTPRVAACRREELMRPDAAAMLAARGFTWPLLIRSAGFHTGEHFEKIDEPAQLHRAVAALPGDDLFAIAFIETRGSDGSYRKYRMLWVDGRLYPVHLAASSAWKVHYFTADRREETQALERSFIADPVSVVGAQAMRALHEAMTALALDYAGIDFAIDRDGTVVVFEANATMIAAGPAVPALREFVIERATRARRA